MDKTSNFYVILILLKFDKNLTILFDEIYQNITEIMGLYQK